MLVQNLDIEKNEYICDFCPLFSNLVVHLIQFEIKKKQ